MANHPTALERAFQLAHLGDHTLKTLRATLKTEGYMGAQISSSHLAFQLGDLCTPAAAARRAHLADAAASALAASRREFQYEDLDGRAA